MQNMYLGSLQIHSNTQDVGFVVEQPIDGIEGAEIRLTDYDKPGEDGAIVSNVFYSGRHINLTGRVSGNTIAEHELNRRSLQYALSLVRNSIGVAQPILLKLLTMDGLSLQANVFPAARAQIKTKSLNHSSFYLQLFAPDFNFYNQSLQSASVAIPSGGGVTYPIIYPVTYASKTGGSITINNAGNSTTLPTVTFTGPLTMPYISNLTAGISFTVNLSLAAGDVLVVDMANKTMLLNGNTNALQYFVSGNTWIYLLPGNNLVSLNSGLSSDIGNAVVSYRDAYLGF